MINLLTLSVSFKNKRQAIEAHLIATVIDAFIVILSLNI